MEGSTGSVTPRQIKAGVLWITGISLLRDGLQFGLTLFLVRLLDPRIYGEFSLVNSFLTLFTVTSTRSFLEHTLQIRPEASVNYQAQFTWGAATQSIAMGAMLAVAAILHHFPRYSAAAIPLAVASIFFLLDWGSELRVKMLERQLDWSRLRLLEFLGLLLGAAAAVVLASHGAGIYALLVPLLLAPVPFAFDLFIVDRWRPNWSLRWKSFQPAWDYGLTRIASGLSARSQQILESVSLVGIVGIAEFGIYGRAVGLATFSCLKLTSLLTLTLFPILTRFHPGTLQFRRAGALILRAVAWSSIPVAALFALFAKELVMTLYGMKWAGVVPLLPWALAIACVTALTEAGAFLLLANLEPKRTLAIDLITLAGTIASLMLARSHPLTIYMAGILGTQFVAAVTAIYWLGKGSVLDGTDLRNALLPPVALTSAFAWLTMVLGPQEHRIGRSILTAALWAAAYVGVLRGLFPNQLSEILMWMPAGHFFRRAFHLKDHLLDDQPVR